jgi:DNA polymerase-4
LQMFDASVQTLKKGVFKSILGYHWYVRLRGWEVDDVDFGRKSFGHTYALGKKTADPEELGKLLMKLCVKVGRRLRRAGMYAQGVHVGVLYTDRSGWHRGNKLKTAVYADQDIFRQALRVLNMQPKRKVVTNLAISVYNLRATQPEQTGLFESERLERESLADAIDAINDRYGDFVITPALMMAMDNTIVDRIAFGGTKDVQDLYGSEE